MANRKKLHVSRKKGRAPGAHVKDYSIKEWFGLVTAIDNEKQLEKGAASDMSNWLTGKEKDHIELRRGYQLLGATRVAGAGKVTGLGVGRRADQRQVPFWTYGTALAYYDSVAKDSAVVNANQWPASAVADFFSVEPYDNIAGYFVYVGSPNAGIVKIPVANPTSPVDQKQNVFRGNFTIRDSTTFLWNKYAIQAANNSGAGAWDKTGIYRSYIDKIALTSYTFTGQETHGVGDGATKTFAANLSQIVTTGQTVRTCFSVEVGAVVAAEFTIIGITKANPAEVQTSVNHNLSAGDVVLIRNVTGMVDVNDIFLTVVAVTAVDKFTVSRDTSASAAYVANGTVGKAEYFFDDKNGVMTSNLGGTGTINYASGAYSVTFATAPLVGVSIVSGYYYEDATAHGIWDFSYTLAARVAGEGYYFRQDDGGNMMGVGAINGVYYCIHPFKTWALSFTSDDKQATNIPYREKVGAPGMLAFDETGAGVPYLNFNDATNPYMERLEAVLGASGSYSIVPKTLSAQLDLSNNGFDNPVVKEWSDFLLLACQSKNNNGANVAFNDTMYVRNKISEQWDKLNIFANVMADYSGILLAGDSITSNVYQLFTGFTDDGGNIPNFWTSGEMNLDLEGLKRFYRIVVDGLISVSQTIQFWLSFDGGSFVLWYTQNGTDTNVDFNNPVTIGSQVLGSKPIGDGSPSGGAINAYHYRKELALGSGIFEYAKLKVVATNVGWAQVNEFVFKDIRYKGRRVASRYVGTEE